MAKPMAPSAVSSCCCCGFISPATRSCSARRSTRKWSAKQRKIRRAALANPWACVRFMPRIRSARCGRSQEREARLRIGRNALAETRRRRDRKEEGFFSSYLRVSASPREHSFLLLPWRASRAGREISWLVGQEGVDQRVIVRVALYVVVADAVQEVKLSGSRPEVVQALRVNGRNDAVVLRGEHKGRDVGLLREGPRIERVLQQ